MILNKKYKKYIDFMKSLGLIYNDTHKTWYIELLGLSEWFVSYSENHFNVITEVHYSDSFCKIRTYNSKTINNFIEFKKVLTVSIKKYKKVLIELKKRDINKDFE